MQIPFNRPHVTGHEHPESDGRVSSPMWKRQERVLRQLVPAR